MKEGALTQPMRMLANMLEARTGQTLSENRLWRLETSLSPVLRAHGLGSLDDLVSATIADPAGPLANQAVNALLNNETSFFRDAHVFRMLEHDLIPHIMADIEAQSRQKVLRIWCAGCSTGQEAYSLAMLFRNQPSWRDWRMQILATDVSSAVVDRARSGLYTQMDVQRGLAINDLLKWMTPAGDKWSVSPVLRDMIEFRVDNLFRPAAPSGKYDLILCRNVLFYFTQDRKRQLFDMLARHCSPGGYLLLGAGETMIGHSTDFSADSRFRGSYQRLRHERPSPRP